MDSGQVQDGFRTNSGRIQDEIRTNSSFMLSTYPVFFRALSGRFQVRSQRRRQLISGSYQVQLRLKSVQQCSLLLLSPPNSHPLWLFPSTPGTPSFLFVVSVCCFHTFRSSMHKPLPFRLYPCFLSSSSLTCFWSSSPTISYIYRLLPPIPFTPQNRHHRPRPSPPSPWSCGRGAPRTGRA